MPRFILMEVYKPPLNPKKVYKEEEDNINLLCGYGKEHNILLYDTVDMYINKTMKNIKTISDSMISIRVSRKEYNARALYYYIKKKLSGKTKNPDIVFPKYDDIKDIMYRKIYNKRTGKYLYTTDSFYLGDSPGNKDLFDDIISRIYIGGEVEVEIKTPIETIVKALDGHYEKMPLITNVVRPYYALCMDMVYVEDNYLEIAPYEMSKYFHEKSTMIDKLYKIKALEAIGLTNEISSRWKEGKSIVNILLREDEQTDGMEDYIYPPDSSFYGIPGMYGDDEFGDNDE